jgi:hypothetical protein
LTEQQQKKVEQIHHNGEQVISLLDKQLLMAKIEDR